MSARHGHSTTDSTDDSTHSTDDSSTRLLDSTLSRINVADVAFRRAYCYLIIQLVVELDTSTMLTSN